MKKSQTFRLLVFLSYTVGVAIGLYLIVVTAWADMESAFYGFSRLAESGLDGFSCPVVMNRDETRMVSLTVSNTMERALSPTVRVEISTPMLVDEYQETIELAPGESKKLEWSIGPENIDLERFIFAKALVFGTYPVPSRETTCGIFILDLPVSGRVILPVLVVLSLLGMGWGLYELNKAATSSVWLEKNVRPMIFLAGVVTLGIFVSFWSGWVPSALLLAVALLMIFILLGTFMMSERRRK